MSNIDEYTIKTAQKIKKICGLTEDDMGFMYDLVHILKKYANKINKEKLHNKELLC